MRKTLLSDLSIQNDFFTSSNSKVILKRSETKKCESFDYQKHFLPPNDENETRHIFRTWKHVAKTEVEIFVRVSVSMATVK